MDVSVRRLQNRLQSTSAATRTTVASAIRYTFTDTASSYDDILAPFIVEFLSLMHDTDLVRADASRSVRMPVLIVALIHSACTHRACARSR